MKGLISVIIPTYNRSAELVNALDSIVAQTYRPIEIIVIDDCSTDFTQKIIENYDSQDLTVHYFYNKQNLGQSASRNLGLIFSKGEYIAFLDSDDQWIRTDKLFLQVDFLLKNPEYGFVATRWKVNSPSIYNLSYGHIFETDEEFRKIALFYYPAHTSTWLIRNSIVEKIGGFSSRRAEDYDYLLKIGQCTKCYCLPFVSEKYNNGSTGAHQKDLIKNWFFGLVICFRYRNSYPFFLLAISNRILRGIKRGFISFYFKLRSNLL